MLIQENQELGRQLSQGRIAQLEAELALQKKYSEELKSSQDGEFDRLALYTLGGGGSPGLRKSGGSLFVNCSRMLPFFSLPVTCATFQYTRASIYTW